MHRYLVSHWQGEHHIVWSVFANGLMVYLALLAIFTVAISPVAWPSATLSPPIPIWLVPIVMMMWSGVGIARSAIRTVKDQRELWVWRAFAVGSLVLVGLSGVGLANDIRYFVSYWMRPYG